MAECVTKTAEKAQENFIRGNRVYILGLFDRSISSEVIPGLIELIDMMEVSKDPVIEIYINSHGGYACELLGLLSVLNIARSKGIKIVTYNIGIAYSCGSLLTVYGDERYMMSYAENLPHLGQTSMQPTTIEQLERGTKHIAEWFSKIIDIYLNHSKLSKKELTRILKDDDCYLNAEECIKYGFCDKII